MPYSEKYYRDWYQQHKSSIADKRKQRYASDPVYRQKALEASRRQQDRSRLPRPKGYDTTLEQLSAKLHLSIWVLRAWRKKDYFPEPLGYAGRRWFTDNQILIMTKLRDGLEAISDGQHRTRQTNLARRDDLVSWVYANWNS